MAVSNDKAVFGWAVLDGEIKVNTVAATRRAAIVNWLMTERRVIAFNDWSDTMIEDWWEKEKGEAEAIEVVVMMGGPFRDG